MLKCLSCYARKSYAILSGNTHQRRDQIGEVKSRFDLSPSLF